MSFQRWYGRLEKSLQTPNFPSFVQFPAVADLQRRLPERCTIALSGLTKPLYRSEREIIWLRMKTVRNKCINAMHASCSLLKDRIRKGIVYNAEVSNRIGANFVRKHSSESDGPDWPEERQSVHGTFVRFISEIGLTDAKKSESAPVCSCSCGWSTREYC
ncbi:unnamed protein product [Gongylonema pulchrum]|uniref:Uncharacterized protein n=1 Tax=Gongylonema pulchrum TaxID=637853 RepID=A0A183E2Q3_9BILA|nr:unnamed protein product [Gongylonema pulchrum]